MDIKKKSIQELQDNIEGLHDKLNALYTDLGIKLMATPETSISLDVIDQFKSISVRSSELTQAVQKIQQGIDRLQEITRFIREIDRHTDDLLEQMSDALENLGRQIFEHYTSAYAPFFSTTYDIVREEGSVMLEKQNRLADLKKQYVAAGVLGKLQIKTKMLALETTISQHRSKTTKAFREGAQLILDSGILKSLESLPEDLDVAYSACTTLSDKMSENKKRASTLADEADAVRKMFLLLGASDNSRRCIESLKEEIRTLDVRSRFLATDAGKNFVGMYMTENGELKKECLETFELSPFRDMLDYASSLKKTLFTNKSKIQSISAEIQIETLTRLVEKKKVDIDGCKKKIATLESLISEYENAVQDAQEQIDSISGQKEEFDHLI